MLAALATTAAIVVCMTIFPNVDAITLQADSR
jgi:hypothetical protein